MHIGSDRRHQRDMSDRHAERVFRYQTSIRAPYLTSRAVSDIRVLASVIEWVQPEVVGGHRQSRSQPISSRRMKFVRPASSIRAVMRSFAGTLSGCGFEPPPRCRARKVGLLRSALHDARRKVGWSRRRLKLTAVSKNARRPIGGGRDHCTRSPHCYRDFRSVRTFTHFGLRSYTRRCVRAGALARS